MALPPSTQTPPSRETLPNELVRPSVAILISVFNRSSFLEQAVASACEQTYPNVHVYLCDDNSKDGGVIDLKVDVLKRKYSNLTYLKNKHRSGGPQGPRKSAAEYGKETWIACLDSDDFFEPTMVEECIAKANENPEAAVVIFGDNVVREDTINDSFQSWSHGIRLPQCEGSILHEVITNQLVLDSHVSICKRAALEDVGGIDDSLKTYDCWEQHIRLARKYSYLSIQRPLLNYRLHGDQMTGHSELFAESLIKVLKKHRKLIRQAEFNTAWEDSLFRLWGHIRNSKGNLGFLYASHAFLLDPPSFLRIVSRFIKKRIRPSAETTE